MLSIKKELLINLNSKLEGLFPEAKTLATFENPKMPEHGDWACTVAMQLAKKLKTNPRILAEKLKKSLEKTPTFEKYIEKIEIAGAGFLNFRLNLKAKQQIVYEILNLGENFGKQKKEKKEKVLVEFVSANPTGPLHVGHGRQAALGDAICNLYASQGFEVTREFYYNDAGVQIETLTKSVQMRAKGFKPGDENWNLEAKDFYNGEYIQDIVESFLNKETVVADDRQITANGNIEDWENIREFSVAYLRAEQDKDLRAFNLKFDSFYLESSLYKNNFVEETVKTLIKNNQTYEKDGALWLKSSNFGDDKDRVMKKSDGTYTYFVPDVAYHVQKFKRGFSKAINIQGTDHHGTIARMRAGLEAINLGIPKDFPDYILHTMVKVVKGGEEVKISKRAGSYVTLRDLIDWTSKDAVRFFLLSRKPDTHYMFDVDLAIANNNENPVFYVQYAHARICSILQNWNNNEDNLKNVDLSSLESEKAQSLIMALSKYPDVLTSATLHNAPHELTFYLRELASNYHSYYDLEKILVDETKIKLARLALISATKQIIKNGLTILGVEAPLRMIKDK